MEHLPCLKPENRVAKSESLLLFKSIQEGVGLLCEGFQLFGSSRDIRSCLDVTAVVPLSDGVIRVQNGS